MVTFQEIIEEQVRIEALATIKKFRDVNLLQEQIKQHVKNIRKLLNDYSNTLEDIADNPKKWESKRTTLLPKLQRERRQLVMLLTGWSKKGY